ncbi:MAG: alpha/beta hydrolase family protein [Phenylobacterium sp.]
MKLTRWIVALALSGLMMALILAGAARAQVAAGDWNGALTGPAGRMRLALSIKAVDGGFEGTAISVDQGGSGAALAGIKLDGQRLSFEIPMVKARYEGQWDAGQQAWVGTFTQGASVPLTLAKGKIAPGPVIAGLDGRWEGAMTLPTANLRFVLRVKTGAYGTIVGLDVPDQLTYGLVISDLKRDGQKVTFSQKTTGSTYAGTLSADGKSIDGAWTQGGVTRALPLALKPPPAAPKRPQTPAKPYPYREVEASIESAPGVVLAGTLTLPPGPGPFPAVAMITGSGAQDRDESLLGHKPFLVIADRLTRSGIAVLRYDDRGYAKSTGDFTKATIADFAVDAEAASAWLRKQPGIDPKRVGLIGHSEGGIIAPMVAARDPQVAFIVMIAGPGAPLGEVMRAQRQALGPGMGQAPESTAKQQAVVDKMLAAMHGSKDDAEAEARALVVLRENAATFNVAPEQFAGIAKAFSSKWIRDLMDYDPGPTLAKVRVPILAVNGSKDLQVPAEQNLSAIRKATAKNRDVTAVELPGLNHLLQTAPTGAAGEYADIEETVAPIALDTISNWVVARTKR